MKKTISISQFEVLAVFGDDVHLKGHFVDDCNPEECVLLINRDLYINLINSFLDDKKEICEANGHFCGLEFIYSDDWTDTKSTDNVLVDIIEEDDDFKPIYDKVRIIRINTFVTEIEHG